MNARKEKCESSDLYCCPITLSPFRHPVLASDGRHYELSDLLEWIKEGKCRSPVTGTTITHVSYDYDLKNELDTLDLSNRHHDYDKEAPLVELCGLLNAAYLPCRQSAYKSVTTANASLILLCLYSMWLSDKNDQSLKASSVLFCLLAVAFADYVMRRSSLDRFSLFTPVNLVFASNKNESSANDAQGEIKQMSEALKK